LDAFDQLDLVAAIAATLIGFVAVFLALSKTDGRFSESDRHFIQALVMVASISIILSLTPRSISLFTDGANAWFASTILALTLASLNAITTARQQISMSRDEAVQIHWIWHFVAWVLGALSALLFVLALFDSTRVVAYYVAGISLSVPLCLWVFIAVVFRRFFWRL
jgi:hypothetical protein